MFTITSVAQTTYEMRALHEEDEDDDDDGGTMMSLCVLLMLASVTKNT